MNWTYTTESGQLTITEYSSGFEMTDNQTNNSTWLGDMVDYFNDQYFNGVMVGSPEFYQLIIEDMEASEAEYTIIINH